MTEIDDHQAVPALAPARMVNERRLDTEIQHPTFSYRLSYRRLLDVQARLLAAHVLGEVPAYVPMLTR